MIENCSVAYDLQDRVSPGHSIVAVSLSVGRGPANRVQLRVIHTHCGKKTTRVTPELVWPEVV